MTTNNNYQRGSEWRKWDLHAHTALDFEWINKPDLKTEEDKKKFAKEYIKCAKSENLSVIGITDHNFCNNLNSVLLPYIQKEAFLKNITILPGFEITAKDGSGIHLLLLFPENTELDKIENIIKQCFPADTILMPNNGQIPVSNKSIDEIKKIIDEAKQEVIFIFAHTDRENGVLNQQTIAGTRRVQEWKKQFIHIAQISKSPDEYEKDSFMYNIINQQDENYKRNMTYIVASDCRSIIKEDETIGRFYLGQKFTWIKADPTFEGLKQIIYEPYERVKIQKNNPGFEYNKPYFDNIKIAEEINIFENIQDNSQQVYFEKTSIPLNKNLVTIIGGRGEGKSLLVNYFANIFNKFTSKSDDEFSKNVNFKVVYSKNNTQSPDTEAFIGNSDNELDFLFIHQNKLKNLSEKKRVGKEIKKLLNLEDLQFNIELNNKTKNLLNDIRATKEWLQEKDEDGDSYHDKAFIEKFKSKYEKLLKNITTKENKEKLEQYTTNIKQINNIKNLISRFDVLKNQFIQTQNGLNNEISELNKIIKKDNQIKDVSFSSQINQIDKNIIQYVAEKTKKEEENKEIKKDFEKGGFSGDLSSLLSNAGAYQGNVGWAEEKLKEISKNNIKLDSYLEKRSKIGKSIKEEYERQAKIIINVWKKIIDNIEDEEHKKLMKDILSDRDISISGEIVFDKDMFYYKLQDYIDMRSSIGVKEDLKLKDVIDFSEFIKNKLPSYVEGEKYEKTKDDLEKLFFDLQERKEYLYTQPKVTYKGKPLHRLSVGQRGTVYLCLKLATGAFSKPIIFDQPEDDLDNEFIMNELIDIFKRLKKYRQTIILTHNANLVVNADAEQVIVAKNNEEKLSYISGSLENKDIIKSVCNILEGGEEAFNKRKNRYYFK